MFHKKIAQTLTAQYKPATMEQAGPRLLAMPAAPARTEKTHPTVDLLMIAARRCSAFFAEAAVLVLVFGVLDFFMLKGRIELAWIFGAFAISLILLAASIAVDFSAHRWSKAHP